MKKQARRALQAAREPVPERVAATHEENRDSCAMVLVPPDYDFHAENVPVGVFAWRQIEAPCGELYRVLWHKLPNGSVGCIPIAPLPKSAVPAWVHGIPPKAHQWEMVGGTDEAPTLTPSVWLRGGWHGWFRAGRMESV